VSAVPDLKQELLDILETPLSPVTVHYAEPQRLPDEYEIVFISGTPNYVRGSGGLLGEQFRSESFGLAFVVEVFKPGDDAQATDQRRWAIVDLIDTALIADDFGGYETEGGTLTERESSLLAYDKGWVARSEFVISVDERE
jgi:hypothetical protein